MHPHAPLIAAALAAGTLAVAAATGMSGCAESDKGPQEPKPIASRGAPPFQPPTYPTGRRIDTIATARLNGSRVPLFLVGSRSDSLIGARFDLLEIFAYDSLSRTWTRVLSDSVESARSIELRDVTGDGREELVVRLDYGGNDPVATFGMNVYSAHGGALRRVFRSTWMHPEVDTLAGVPGIVITVRHALWPLFAPRSDATIYIDDIYGFRDGRFRSVLAEARGYYRSEADSAVARFRALRDSVERHLAEERRRSAAARDSLEARGDTSGVAAVVERDTLSYEQALGLYRWSALGVLYRLRSGDERGARTFWAQQRPFLRSVLPEEQYEELAEFNDGLLSPG